jgi:molybdopterin-containing oxidoreductase family membrane subunit
MSATAENTRPILPPDQSLGDVTDQLARIPLHFPTRGRWLIALALSSLLLLLFLVAVTEVFSRGVGVWGLNIPVNWAFAIHNYVWWLGIGHAGTPPRPCRSAMRRTAYIQIR